jgi:hypothetical protein
VRAFLIVWATQSVSVIGSALTFFATTIWLSSQLYPQAHALDLWLRVGLVFGSASLIALPALARQASVPGPLGGPG